MKRARWLLIGAMMLAISLVTSSAAYAASIGRFEFVGTMTAGRGMYYPIVGPSASGASWTLTSTACVGFEISFKKVPPVNGPTCSLQLSGTFNSGLSGAGAWCEVNGATGSGALSIGPNLFVISNIQWAQSAFDYVMTGSIVKPSTGQSGIIVINMDAFVDVPGGESCSPSGPGADRWIVVGSGDFNLF